MRPRMRFEKRKYLRTKNLKLQMPHYAAHFDTPSPRGISN